MCGARELRGGSRGGGGLNTRMQTLCANTALSRIPESLRREEVRFRHEAALDKIFASRWISPDTVCFGTKDNKLILWSYLTHDTRCIPLPRISPLAGGSTPPVMPPESPPHYEPHMQCGIHDIDIASDRSVLICGADDPSNVAVFALPSFEPLYVMRGHLDWVFASRFVADGVVATGSRDGMLMLWNVPPLSPSAADLTCDDREFSSPGVDGGDKRRPNHAGPVLDPTAVRVEHQEKLRCIERLYHTPQFLTLSGDGTTKLWDCETVSVSRSIELADRQDLVALAVNEDRNVVAVGSQAGTFMFDPRESSALGRLECIGDRWGVRCLTFNKDVLTIGSGGGTIAFYDLRQASLRRIQSSSCLKCSSGSMQQPAESIAAEIGGTSPQAAYTIQYDCMNTKVFVGGGPLISGVVGCYAAVWG